MMSTPDLQLRLNVVRGDFRLRLDETITGTGVTAVFGRSGSGKSTLLRSIAGFSDAGSSVSGAIRFGEECWFDDAAGVSVSAHQRGVGYMFQDPRLFAHLNVTRNLQFAQRRSAAFPAIVSWDDVIAALALQDLLERMPDQLSGGEAQRVALGRTLLTAPRLLLLDEPLAALDDQHKQELLPFLDAVVQRFDLPVVYVSHDVEEVARLADHMLVLNEGQVVDRGSVTEVFERLDVDATTGRFDASVLLPAQVHAIEDDWGLVRLNVAGQELRVPHRADLQPGFEVRMRIRARDVAIAVQRPEGLSIRNALAGQIVRIEQSPDSPYADVWIALAGDHAGANGAAAGGTQLRSRITRAAVADLALREGLEVFGLVKSVTLDR